MAKKQSETRPIDVIRRCSSLARRSITIPEWDGLTLYFGKITISDWDAVEARDPKTQMDRNVEMLLSMAQLENGEPAFNRGDREPLRKDADLTVLQRVINFMYESAYSDIEQAEDAIKENPFSESA